MLSVQFGEFIQVVGIEECSDHHGNLLENRPMLWNLCNMLKCNLSKTEIINFSSRFSPAEPIGSP